MEQKPIAWRRAQVVTQTQYEDGSGHISDLCFASGASARIVGNGSTQAPLDVVLTPAERAAGELLEAPLVPPGCGDWMKTPKSSCSTAALSSRSPIAGFPTMLAT